MAEVAVLTGDSRTVQPGGPLTGRLRVPGDKSISHRALMFGAIAEGRTRVTGFLDGADCLATLTCLRLLGVSIEGTGTVWTVEGVGLRGFLEPETILDVGNSGTSIRLLMGLLAGFGGAAVLTGDASVRSRPMERVAGPLRLMGMRIDGRQNGERAPLLVRGGTISPISFDCAVSSAQVKSAVLLAGLRTDGETVFTEPTRSRDHTERMLAAMGADLIVEGTTVRMRGNKPLNARDVEVPGDLSSAAFWLVGAAIVPGSDLTLEHVGLNPSRTGIVDALLAMGADLTVENAREECGEPVGDIRVRYGALKAARVADELLTRAIDEVPILALAMACAEGASEITDAAELRIKESDRLAAVARVLGGLGAQIDERPDGLVVHGPTNWRGGDVDTKHDHRIAMTAAIAGLAGAAPVTIHGTASTETSYPGFWEHLP